MQQSSKFYIFVFPILIRRTTTKEQGTNNYFSHPVIDLTYLGAE